MDKTKGHFGLHSMSTSENKFGAKNDNNAISDGGRTGSKIGSILLCRIETKKVTHTRMKMNVPTSKNSPLKKSRNVKYFPNTIEKVIFHLNELIGESS